MTPQEIFNKVVTHLRQQGKKSESPDRFVAGSPQCLYRGPNGTKCAAGCLIDDEDYCPEFEGLRITSLTTKSYFTAGADEKARRVTEKLGLHGQNGSLLGVLQSTHDGCAVSAWERRFAEVAKVYGLKYEPAGA